MNGRERGRRYKKCSPERPETSKGLTTEDGARSSHAHLTGVPGGEGQENGEKAVSEEIITTENF